MPVRVCSFQPSTAAVFEVSIQSTAALEENSQMLTDSVDWQSTDTTESCPVVVVHIRTELP
jgi:hypothetical protein